MRMARPVLIGVTALVVMVLFALLVMFARAFFGSARRPMSPSTAGVKVTAMSTAMVTLTPPTMPMPVTAGMPVTTSATRARTTVEPANTTALPAVPLASAIESTGDMPVRSCRRWRFRMNSE